MKKGLLLATSKCALENGIEDNSIFGDVELTHLCDRNSALRELEDGSYDIVFLEFGLEMLTSMVRYINSGKDFVSPDIYLLFGSKPILFSIGDNKIRESLVQA